MFVGRVAAIDKSTGGFQTTNGFNRMREVHAEEEVAKLTGVQQGYQKHHHLGGHASCGRDAGLLDRELRGDGRADGPLGHRMLLRVSHIPNPI